LGLLPRGCYDKQSIVFWDFSKKKLTSYSRQHRPNACQNCLDSGRIALVLPELLCFWQNQLTSARIVLLLAELLCFCQNYLGSRRITLLLRELLCCWQNQDVAGWNHPDVELHCFDSGRITLILAESKQFCQNQNVVEVL